jgi:hypothetical protein
MPVVSRPALCGSLVGLAACGLLACGGLAPDVLPGSEPPPLPSIEHPPEPDPCASGAFCFDGQLGSELQPLSLGGRATLTTAVVLSPKTQGQTVRFSVKTEVPANDLLIEVSPQQITAGAETNIPVTIRLRLPTGSAYDGGKTLSLHAELEGPAAQSGDSRAVAIPVDPKLVVEYAGKGGTATPHTWTIPGNDPLPIGAAGAQAPTPVKLRRGGVRVQLVNKDASASHVLHCSGPIPHQPVNQPTPPGGAYSVTVQTAGTASCYDHNLESQSVAVYFQFNN